MSDYLAALMVGNNDAYVELVDLGAMAPVNVFTFPDTFIVSIAARTGLLRLYLTDARHDLVLVVDGSSGAVQTSIPLLGPQGCILSPDEKTLYVASGTAGFSKLIVNAIDTTSFAVKSSGVLPLNLLAYQRIAVSPDGTRLAVASMSPAPVVKLLDALSLTVTATITMAPGSSPQHAMFVTNDLLLVWDTNADRLYQIDVPTASQLTGATVQLTSDVSWHNGECTAYSRYANRACIIKSLASPPVNWAVSVVDPFAKTFDTYTGFKGPPTPICLTQAERQALVAVDHRFDSVPGPARLSVLDFDTKAITHDVYTFATTDVFPAWMVTTGRPWDWSHKLRVTALITQILAGIVDDSGGVVIPPGGGPPGGVAPWTGRWRELPAGTRDVLLGLGLHELAGLASPSTQRTEIQRLALSLAAGGLTRLASR